MKKPTRNNDASWKKLGNKTLILSTRIDGKMHELNHTGDFLWSLCDGINSTKEITKKFQSHFDIDEQIAIEDVNVFLETLSKKKLLFEGEFTCE